MRTYSGHKQAVRDITFNNSGTEFLSCGYDRYIKLWDTETGKEISKIFTFWLPACLKISYSIILILLLSIDFLTGLNIWIYIYFIEMVWKCIMVHIYHCEKFSTSIYSVKKCQENILLIFMILLNRSVNSLFKKSYIFFFKLILFRVTYKYVFAVRFMALCFFHHI